MCSRTSTWDGEKVNCSWFIVSRSLVHRFAFALGSERETINQVLIHSLGNSLPLTVFTPSEGTTAMT
jgi:hypothetical protein